MSHTRRSVLAASAGASLAGQAASPRSGRGFGAIVVGAGVFGAWTAEHLRRAGRRVLLVDQMGPANSRASSGGESRMTRSIYGRDAVYARMAVASLAEWRSLSDAASLPLYHPIGFLFLFGRMEDYARSSIETRRELGLTLQTLDRAELARRWPQIELDGLEFGLYEPDFGALMARRSVAELVRRFAARGGEYRHGRAVPDPQDGHVVVINGEAHHASAIVYACGPWLPKIFPDILGERIFVTRQEIAFMAPPNGDARFEAHALPGWADFNGGDMYYGFPNLEGRGFKIAHDTHGAPFDPDTGDRSMSVEGAARVRAFAARRFPALAGRPFTEFRVCQYENSSNGDFLIDRHPTLDGAFLLGAGSGHGFKHGPEVGRLMADLALDRTSAPEPRFSLTSKQTVHRREVL